MVFQKKMEKVMMMKNVVERIGDTDLPRSTPRLWDMPELKPCIKRPYQNA